MKLLSLFITFAILLYTSFAYDVYFDKDFKMFIDKEHRAEISNCRYNSSKVVYCDAKISYQWACKDAKNNSDHSACYRSFAFEGFPSEKFKLTFDINLRKFTSKCRDSFKTTSHFKKVNLMYDNKNEDTIADLSTYVKSFKIAESFKPMNSKKYYFRFETKNNCVFYGDIKIISSTKL
ncbi:hypothetical protein PIROE2DRAFT_11777 [Piromyces sp. E2]|nr:hypothetical protein PIROE2DRAFT_11777 [Piromyces sp. E2]|eukprot:OUM62069.1 hypothetical protein PIROE2DRAFT_11777 [Piromyces sp. E2]